MRKPNYSAAEALHLVQVDHKLLYERVDGLTEQDLRAPYQVSAGPLGDFCESLHDLVGHIMMWDEITLAVLREAAAGRQHWSLDPRWETSDAGRALNLGGVDANRHVPSELLVHRMRTTAEALEAELASYDEITWLDPTTGGGFDGSVGALAEYVSTTPDNIVYAHAARHLKP